MKICRLKLSKNLPTKGFEGKKSVKGNRQGFLKVNCRKAAREGTLGCSRSITRPQAAKLQNKISFLCFAILTVYPGQPWLWLSRFLYAYWP